MLTNVDNLIQGEGNLGANSSQFINQAAGVINANVASRTLTIDPNGDGFVNRGLLKATNGGILSLTGNAGGAFDNTGATILADGSEVQLTASVSVSGGILSAINDGLIRAVTGQSVYLSNLTLKGPLVVDNNADLHINGTITNNGTITLNAANSSSRLFLDCDSTLTGGGTLTLASTNDQSNAQITGGHVLTNVNNLIQGEGNLGANSSQFINQAAGVINANVASRTLTIDPNGNGFVNRGLLEATNGGILSLTGNAGGAFDNTGGTILADGEGSEVQLTASLTLSAGLLEAMNGGLFRAVTGQSIYLSNLTLVGSLIVDNNADLHINGTIDNQGTITFNADNSLTRLFLDGDSTLTGGGTLTLASTNDQSNAQITGGHVLTNFDNTIEGEGNLGANSSQFLNQAAGTINANVEGRTIVIDPNGNGFVNQGLLEATNGGKLFLTGNAGGSFNNSGTIAASGGTIQIDGALTSSGTVDVGSDSLVITNSGTYTQTAGTFRVAGGSVTSSTALNFAGGLVDARGSITAAITNNAILQPAIGGSRTDGWPEPKRRALTCCRRRNSRFSWEAWSREPNTVT